MNGTLLNVILIVMGVAFVLFAAVAIPFLIQIWQTARGISQTLQVLNESLPGIMANLEAITSQLRQTTTTVNRQVESFSLAAERLRGTLNLLVGLEEILRRGFGTRLGSSLKTTVALSKGIGAFLSMLMGDSQARPKTPRR